MECNLYTSTSQTTKPPQNIWGCDWTQRTLYPSSQIILPTFSNTGPNYSTPGVSLAKRTGRDTQTLLGSWSRRSHWGTSPPHCLKASQTLQTLSSLPTMTIPPFNFSSWFSPCPFSYCFSTPNSSPKSSSSYHTALPLFPPLEICCLGCGETGHLLEQCGNNYWWNHVLDQYVVIPCGKLKKSYYHPLNDPDIYLELKKTGKSHLMWKGIKRGKKS